MVYVAAMFELGPSAMLLLRRPSTIWMSFIRPAYTYLVVAYFGLALIPSFDSTAGDLLNAKCNAKIYYGAFRDGAPHTHCYPVGIYTVHAPPGYQACDA